MAKQEGCLVDVREPIVGRRLQLDFAHVDELVGLKSPKPSPHSRANASPASTT
jgi:hypothetical protein